MKFWREPPRLDSQGETEADVELARALRALAQDRPSPEELERVRLRLEANLSQQVTARAQAALLQPVAGLIVVAAALLSLLPSPAHFVPREEGPAGERCAPVTAHGGELSPLAVLALIAPPERAPTPPALDPAQRVPRPRKVVAHRPAHLHAYAATVSEAASPSAAVPLSAASDLAPPQPSGQRTSSDAKAVRAKAETAAPASPSVAPRVALDEATLLQRARQQAREPKLALRWLDEHKRLFPRGMLSQEREVLAIQLLRALSQDGPAAQRVQAFRRDFPQSIYLPRLGGVEVRE